MTFENVKSLDKKFYMNTFGDRTPLCFKSGDGIRLRNIDDEVYTDFFAGIAVSSLGYNYKRLTDELCEQVKNLIHTSNVYYIENQAKLAQMLVENSCADRVFFASTGAEANEGALKLAKKYFYQKGENRTEFITLKDSFHGRTLATVAATGQEKYQKPYAPLVEKFIHVERNNKDQIKSAFSKNTVAVILEVIQGESGVYPLEKDYVNLARKLCDEYGSMLIIDEVQTGIGRTGKLFAYEHYGIEPDIFTLAKGLGGGVPISAFCAKAEAASGFNPGDHGTTFGGNPLSTRAGLVVIDELINNGILDHAKDMGDYLGEKLDELEKKNDKVAQVRGVGLMRGIEFKDEIAREVVKSMLDKKYLVGVVGTRILRIVPPLVLTKDDIDGFIKTLGEVIG